MPGSPTRWDRPSLGSRARIERSIGVLGVWLLAAVPAALGAARCPIAVFLHRPCPGCGMSRAVHLLAQGALLASLRMHPLAVPSALGAALVAVTTVWATYTRGSPLEVWEFPAGRWALFFFGAVSGLTLVLWLVRAFGALGGPVPV
jgi:hypothetical protein